MLKTAKIVLTLVAALGLIATALFCGLDGVAAGAQPTVLQFPNDRIVGSVLLVLGEGEQGSNFQKFAPAQGKVVVPAGKDFMLRFLDVADSDKSWTNAFKNVKVRYLDLQKMPFKDNHLGFLVNFKHVDHLQLDRTDISDRGVKELCAILPEIEFLGISRTEVTSRCFKDLAGLKKLRKLHIGSNLLGTAGFNDISRLSNLAVLRIESSQLTDAELPAIVKLKNLRTLKLASNKGITDRGLAKISTMENLTGINLSRTGVTAAGISSLKKMKKLVRIELDCKSFPVDEMKRLRHDLAPIHLKDVSNSKKLPMEIFDPLH